MTMKKIILFMLSTIILSNLVPAGSYNDIKTLPALGEVRCEEWKCEREVMTRECILDNIEIVKEYGETCNIVIGSRTENLKPIENQTTIYLVPLTIFTIMNLILLLLVAIVK